jgi:hypothetical protein
MTSMKSDDNENGPSIVVSKVVGKKSNLTRQLSSDSLSVEELSMERDDEQPLSNETTKKETKDVLHLKVLVILILVISATTIASGAFLYITRGETSQFEAKYYNDAAKVLDGVGSSLHRTLGLLDSLAVTCVSYANSQNNTWPFVALPDFGARMAKVLPLTDAAIISLLPIVYPGKREEWEAYSVEQNDWVNQSIAIQETWSGYYGPIDYGWQPNGVIYGDEGDIDSNTR